MATFSAAGALRIAHVALSTNGGFEVLLRMPGMAASGNDAEQLGLASPQFADIPIGPAMWRKTGSTTSLLLEAASVTQLVGSQKSGSAEVLFETAIGVVVDGVLYGIVGCHPLLMAGVACAYRLVLEAPTWA